MTRLAAPAREPARPSPRPMQGALQRKLSVGASNDPLEHEADRVADRIVAQRPAHDFTAVPARIQRAAAPAAGGLQDAPASVHATLARGGRPLDAPVRRDMEQRFAHDFSRVRIHDDTPAARSACAIQANAYAVGRDIVFGAGRYAPATPGGMRLLAHELTHVVQQGGAGGGVIQRDLAVEPTVATPADVALTPAQLQAAVAVDRVYFRDAAEIGILRDVLGIASTPAVVDTDFAGAVARYQASFALTIDGKLGAGTAAKLADEVTAEADTLGEAATGTARRRVARRLHLRSMTSRKTGTARHQGFVGPDANPDGAVTARTGDSQGGNANSISLEYTGENANSVDWLQFINVQMTATPPAAAAPVFNAGTLATTGGVITWSNAATTNWSVDAVPGASPLYNVGGLSTRAAGRRIAMFDQPGGPSWLPAAQAFTATTGAAAGAPSATLTTNFDSYAIRANQARYHVAWSATTQFTITPPTTNAIAYTTGAAGEVTGLAAAHRAALVAKYAGSTIV